MPKRPLTLSRERANAASEPRASARSVVSPATMSEFTT